MSNKIKTVLKTTAAVASLMMGAQSWAATLTGEDGVDYATTGRDMTVDVASLDATAAGAAAGKFTTKSGSKLYLIQTTAATYSGNWTFGAGTNVHLTLTDNLTLSEKFTSPKGKTHLIVDSAVAAKKLILGTGIAGTSLDSKQFDLSINVDSTVNFTADGELSLPIKVAKDKTLTIGDKVTTLSSKLSGAGNVKLDALTVKVSSDLSDFTGKLTLEAADVNFVCDLSTFKGTLVLVDDQNFSKFSKNLLLKLPQVLELATAAAKTVTMGAGTFKRVVATGGWTLTSTGNATIEELNLSALAQTSDVFTFKPTAGTTVTIRKITGLNAFKGSIDNTDAGIVLLPPMVGFKGKINGTATASGPFTLR